jgi:hypothetical protein
MNFHNNNNNIKIPQLSIKNDKKSIEERKYSIKRMTIEQLINSLSVYKNELRYLEELSQSLNSSKDSNINKSKELQNFQNKLTSNIRALKASGLALENCKKLLIGIKKDNINISSGYTDIELKLIEGEDINKYLTEKVNKLISNTNKTIHNRLISFPNTFDHKDIKEKIVKYISNNVSVDISSVIETCINTIKSINNQDLLIIFNSLSHFGTLSHSYITNEDYKMEKILDFSGEQKYTSWNEINIHLKTNLSVAINNLININHIHVNTLKTSNICNTFEEVIKQQVLSLNKKETEIGIKNNLLVIFLLCSIYEPFIGIDKKIQADISVKKFINDISKFRDNIKVLTNNIELTIESLDFIDKETTLKTEYFNESIKLLSESIYLSNDERKDLLVLKQNFDNLYDDKQRLKLYTEKLSRVSFDIDSFEKLAKQDISYILKNTTISTEKINRNSNQSIQLFEFFKNNEDYVKTLNNKLNRIKLIHQIRLRLLNNENEFTEVKSLKIIDLIIEAMDLNQISIKNMLLIDFFIKKIEVIQEQIRVKQEVYSNDSKINFEAKMKYNKSDLEIVIEKIIDKINAQSFKNRISLNKSLSLDDLRFLIPSIQTELNSLLSCYKDIMLEVEDEISERKILNKDKSLNTNQSDDFKKGISLNEKIDPRTIRLDNLDINQILNDMKKNK